MKTTRRMFVTGGVIASIVLIGFGTGSIAMGIGGRSDVRDSIAQEKIVGTPGSGVPNLMDRLFEVNRIDPKTIQISRLEQTPATVAFLGGELDALVFASAPESLMVQMLLQTPGVKLLDFAQSEAYSRRFSFLSPVMSASASACPPRRAAARGSAAASAAAISAGVGGGSRSSGPGPGAD